MKNRRKKRSKALLFVEGKFEQKFLFYFLSTKYKHTNRTAKLSFFPFSYSSFTLLLYFRIVYYIPWISNVAENNFYCQYKYLLIVVNCKLSYIKEINDEKIILYLLLCACHLSFAVQFKE